MCPGPRSAMAARSAACSGCSCTAAGNCSPQHSPLTSCLREQTVPSKCSAVNTRDNLYHLVRVCLVNLGTCTPAATCCVINSCKAGRLHGKHHHPKTQAWRTCLLRSTCITRSIMRLRASRFPARPPCMICCTCACRATPDAQPLFIWQHMMCSCSSENYIWLAQA